MVDLHRGPISTWASTQKGASKPNLYCNFPLNVIFLYSLSQPIVRDYYSSSNILWSSHAL